MPIVRPPYDGAVAGPVAAGTCPRNTDALATAAAVKRNCRRVTSIVSSLSPFAVLLTGAHEQRPKSNDPGRLQPPSVYRNHRRRCSRLLDHRPPDARAGDAEHQPQ